MAAIGRFQKGDEIFYAKVVDGELFRLHGDVFGSPSFDKKADHFKGLTHADAGSPTKVIAVGLNYADHARESGKPVPKGAVVLAQGADFADPRRREDRSAVCRLIELISKRSWRS